MGRRRTRPVLLLVLHPSPVEQSGAQLEDWQRDWKAQGIKSNPGGLESASSHLCRGSLLVLRCLRFSQRNNGLIRARVKKLLNEFVSHRSYQTTTVWAADE